MSGPGFTRAEAAAYDKWLDPPDDDACERCVCDDDAAKIMLCECRCHWTKEDSDADAADARYDREKED